MQVHLTLLNFTLKNGYDGKLYVLCILLQLKEHGKKEGPDIYI